MIVQHVHAAALAVDTASKRLVPWSLSVLFCQAKQSDPQEETEELTALRAKLKSVQAGTYAHFAVEHALKAHEQQGSGAFGGHMYRFAGFGFGQQLEPDELIEAGQKLVTLLRALGAQVLAV